MKEKEEILDKLEVLIDMAINFDFETYDRDVLESIYNLFDISSDGKQGMRNEICIHYNGGGCQNVICPRIFCRIDRMLICKFYGFENNK